MDLNVTAFRIVQKATDENKREGKISAGQAGGRVGGPARAKKLSAEQRKEIALKASHARWA